MTIDERVRNVFADVFELEPAAIDDDLSIDTCEVWDSMQSIVLASSLEDEFGIAFSEDELMQFASFTVIRAFVHSHLSKSGVA